MLALVAHGPSWGYGLNSTTQAPSICEIELLDDETLRGLFEKAYLLGAQDKKITLMTDLPQSRSVTLENEYWSKRVPLMWDMARKLQKLFPDREISMVFFESALKHGGSMPEEVFVARSFEEENLPFSIGEAAEKFTKLRQADFLGELLKTQVVFGGTQFSITGFLQGQVRRPERRAVGAPKTENAFKALSVIGFNSGLFPSVRLITEKHDQVLNASRRLIEELSGAESVTIEFEVTQPIPGYRKNFTMSFDTRGKIPLFEPQISVTGGVDNLPMGEVWMVPVDGLDDESGMISQTSGVLPVQLSEEIDGSMVTEIVLFQISENMVSKVLTNGPISQREKLRLKAEPFAYAVAELGFGALGHFGFEPLPSQNPSSTMNNEKLGIHVAFGLNAHWADGGGKIDIKAFNDPKNGRHQDYVYVSGMQPGILVKKLTVNRSGHSKLLVENGNYVEGLF